MNQRSGAAKLLEMEGISKRFPGVQALDGVDFDLRSGEVHVLLGENGAGKSTLMKILSGAYARDAGTIRLRGEGVRLSSPADAQSLGISTIYQEFNLIPHLRVCENIFLGREPTLWPGIIDRHALESESQALLDALGAAVPASARVETLSVAEQQMVEVAKALSLEARVLIMDEPSSALSDSEIERLFETIRRLQREGVGVVYISHRLEEIAAIGDRVTVLRDGRVVGTHRVGEVSLEQLIREMANRDLDEHYPRQPTPPGEELLRVEGLSSEGRLRDVGLTLRRGEIVGVAGLVGAGRTALARALFGADSFDSGSVYVHGRPARIRSPAQAIAQGMGFLTEDRKGEGLVLNLSVAQNMALPNLGRLSRWGVVDSEAVARMARRFVESLRIKTPSLEQPVEFLSGGNQQKAVLAKWLAGEADVLLFDEPTRGIDVAAKVEIYRLMNQLTAGGAGILMISSDLPEILGMSDRILVMRDGAVVARFSREEASQEKLLAAALGHAAEARAG